MNNEQTELKTLKDEYLMGTRRLSRVRSKANRKLRMADVKSPGGWKDKG